MRRGALIRLLARPLTIVCTALCLPVAVIALFAAGAKSAAGAIVVSALTCATLGAFVGEGISQAARCSFAWTLPRFRRALLLEFAAGGLLVSSVSSAIVAVSATGTPTAALVAGAAGFAAFSLAGGQFLVPGASLLIPLAGAAAIVAGSSAPAAVLETPLATVGVAIAGSAGALWFAFGSLAFRWSSLAGPRRDGSSPWHEWRTLPWWPTSRRRARRAAPSPGPHRYVGTSVLSSVIASQRSTKATRWLPGLILSVGYVVFVGPIPLASVSRTTFVSLWALVVFVPLMWGWHPGSGSRAMLPWPRRHHLAVAFARSVGEPLVVLLVLSPALAVFAYGNPEWLGTMGRAIAVLLMFHPAFQFAAGPPIGGQWPDRLVGVILVVTVLAILAVPGWLIVTGLPTLVSSAAAQALVLGLALVGCQLLNWRRLRHYFAQRDLVGDSP